MIIAYFVFFVLGVVAFILMTKFGLQIRIGVALAIFVVPSIVLMVWIAQVRDKPSPDAVTIVPKLSAVPKNPESKDPE